MSDHTTTATPIEGEAPAPTPGMTDESAKLLKEVMKNKADNKALKAQLAAYGDHTPESLKALASKLQADAVADTAARHDAEQDRLIATGRWDEAKALIVAEHLRNKQALDDRLAAMHANVIAGEHTIRELTIGQAFAGSAFIGETVFTPAKARKLYGDHFDFEEGQIIPYDAPRGAPDRSPLTDGMGEPITLDAALRRLVMADPEADQILRSARNGSKATAISSPTTPASIGIGASRIGAALASGELKKAGVDGIPQRPPMVPHRDFTANTKAPLIKRDFNPGDQHSTDVMHSHIGAALASGALPALMPRKIHSSAG